MLQQCDLDYGGRNLHYTKSLICIMKTPIVEFWLYSDNRTPNVEYDLEDKVEGDIR